VCSRLTQEKVKFIQCAKYIVMRPLQEKSPFPVKKEHFLQLFFLASCSKNTLSSYQSILHQLSLRLLKENTSAPALKCHSAKRKVPTTSNNNNIMSVYIRHGRCRCFIVSLQLIFGFRRFGIWNFLINSSSSFELMLRLELKSYCTLTNNSAN